VAAAAVREQFELPLAESVATVPIEPTSAPQAEPIKIDLVGFTDSFTGERVGLAAYTLLAAGLITMAARGILPVADVFAVLAGGLGCLGMFLTCCYASCPEVHAKVRVWMEKELRRNEQVFAQQAFATLAGLYSWLDAAEKRRLAAIDAAKRRRIGHEKDRVAEVKRSLGHWMDDLENRRKALEAAAAQEPLARLAALQQRYHAEVAQLREITRTVPINMRPKDQRVIRKWEKRLNDLLQSGPPQAIPAPELEEIRISCRLEGESLKGCAAFARLGAHRKMKRIRRQRSRHRVRLRAKIERTQARFAERKRRLRVAVNSSKAWLDGNQVELTRSLREFNRYEGVRFGRFLQHVVIGPPKPTARHGES
jgi:hypothetical protein